ncbi:MAG: asparagine synthase (glutamine-hydrolyzing) [Sulfuricaulis sp.]
MCGIVGFSGRFSRELLEKMNLKVSHRGPDDFGAYFIIDKGIGLAHRRLSIIDLSPLGHQPMWDSTNTVAIIFNGEIYNYLELRADLIARGCRFNSQSDTEVLLNLYLHDGEAMLPRLNGIFAFAIWDTRDDSLFIARDGLGVKPLYYAETPKGLLFASELKALLEEPDVDRSLNIQAVHYHMIYLWCPAPYTILNGVKKLEPGHAMVVKEGRVRRSWRYYDMPYDQPIEQLSEQTAISQVEDALREAVTRQMVADVPVGAFLSGGLDSSAVAAFAREASPGHKLQCFTIGFKDASARKEGMTEDLPYAQRVARHLDVDLHTIYVGPEMVGRLEEMIYHLDEPQADPAPLNALFISQLAREHGIKVLLSGAGGDDIFTGYRRHYALMQEKSWGWMPAPVRLGISKAARMLPHGIPWARRLSKAFQYANLNGDERIVSYFFWFSPEALENLYASRLRGTAAYSMPLLSSLANLPDDTQKLNRMLYLEGKHFLADHNLNYTDKMSMAAGVEVRVPLLDPDLVALAARLPVRFKQNGRVGKWVFKKAMEPYLPKDVIYRPKTGFGVPLRHWLRYELRPVVEDVLSKRSIEARGLFDAVGIQELIDNDRNGRVDGTYTIFSLICIELWCRIFLDRRGFSQ